MKPRRLPAYLALPLLLFGDAKTPLELLLVRASAYSVFTFAAGGVLWALSGVSQASNSRYTLLQRTAIGIVAVSAIVYIMAFVVAGSLVLGRQAGHNNPVAQIAFTLGKVCLFVLLPCLLITLIIVFIAALTGNWRP